jgi:hypothetical protein
VQGPIGATGAKGATGATGLTGSTGATGATGSTASNTVTVVVASANATRATAVCAPGSHVVGGGGSAIGVAVTGGNASNLQSSYPSDASGVSATAGTTNPPAWTANFFQSNASNTAWALCVPN